MAEIIKSFAEIKKYKSYSHFKWADFCKKQKMDHGKPIGIEAVEMGKWNLFFCLN